MHRLHPRQRLALGAVFALALAACTDRLLTPETPAPQPEPELQRELTCTANVASRVVSCDGPAPSTGGASGAILGGQNRIVKLTSTNFSYDEVTFEFDVTLQNLLGVTAGLAPQAMGTPDGVVADSIRIFFSDLPAATGEGSGTIEVLPDGTGFFTGADQPYYRYAGLLAPGATTAARRWRFSVPPTVTTFTFSVYVLAKLQPALVINEIMANPSAADDSLGEYIEIHNAGLDSVDLTGWRIASRSGSSTEQVTLAGPLGIPAGGHALIAARSNPARNGGITAHAEWGGTAIQLSNSTSATAPDFVALRYPSALGTRAAVDSVIWATGGATTAPPTARSRELLDPLADNTVMAGSAWNTAYRVSGEGDGEGNFDRGTPGEKNAPFVPVGPPARLSISPSFLVIDSLRQFRRFSAFAEDTLGQPATVSVTWTSLDPSIATIDATGLVTHVDTGQVQIVVTGAGLADTTLYSIFSYSPGPVYRNHVEFGQPSPGGAPGDTTDMILSRPEYILSYNAARGGPNWVSWNLNRTHFGRVPRAPTFYADTALKGVYLVTTNDYTNSGQTRGHMTQSEQRTQTRAANDATFFLSNILPQVEDLNTGPWQLLEEHTNDITRFHQREVYNIAGALYPATPQTLKGEGKVDIPSSTWKIVVVLPYGQGLADVTSAADLQVIAVNMPNTQGIRGNPWQMYVTTVDALEAATGYDFLAALPDDVEAAVEAN